MERLEIANALRETGQLLNISGGNPYKARAYLKGASAIESLSEPLDDLVNEDRLTEIPGIGSALAATIKELYDTGETRLLKSLRAEHPPGVIALSEIPGMTLKRITALHQELGIDSIEALEQACLEHRVAAVKGFGSKTEATILKSLQSYRAQIRKTRLVDAIDAAEDLERHLSAVKSVQQAEIAGEVRRWMEVVDQITVVAETTNSEALWKALKKFPLVTEVVHQDEQQCRVRLTEGLGAEVIAVSNFGAGLIEHTGNELHIEQLREYAREKKLELRPDGLYKGSKKL
ncbi:MAG TPA: helix-hairpin-helix domain-containing protein, partial [Chroococcales cyanobacterium]